ncbi:NepR family anti-sigma factor [Alteraurantiacibacter aquimixticola]|uniref:Anti-sigma factor NepR domain-containing protein n=1 Tax=Alteraurantiacibacter aquimixticola TaxID=2489173 RepID=A0A4T3F1U7_9SPHN|nr:NepR family anti-sigma factor [Alteraurantiacibacter aquimixticola]TIX51136.1 hypothetical protein E5222_01250 [Alteraurantiacibacter aquimixticola]
MRDAMLQHRAGGAIPAGRMKDEFSKTMNEQKKSIGSATGEPADAEKPAKADSAKPDWADGLKQFYDSVVDEPLPDELSKLLAQLDDGDDA